MSPSIALLILTLLGGALGPQDPSQPASSVAERVQAVLDEHAAARTAFGEAYSQAQTELERQRIFETLYPQAVAYCGRLMTIAEAAPADPGTASALLWVLQQTDDEALSQRVLGTLAEHHLQSEVIDRACAVCERKLEGVRAFLETVAEHSESADTRARARYSLARHLIERAGSVATGSAGLLLEAETLLELVAAQAPAVTHTARGTLGAACAAELFELRHLQVGLPAPEIEGQDLDGVSFKLSDYRGKVVVLDFWGNW